MFGRNRKKDPERSSAPAVGIGALVTVKPDPRGVDEWVGEPIGVVVGSAGNEVYGYPGIATPRIWLIAFEDFQYMVDGRGPFENANVPEWRLQIVAPTDETQTSSDFPSENPGPNSPNSDEV